MLRIDVAAELPEVVVLAHREDGAGISALRIQPKVEVDAAEAAPKEILFVLDGSGSMSDTSIEMPKRCKRWALRTLGPKDCFHSVRFSGSAEALAPERLPRTAEAVRSGLEAVESMRGTGGTEMLAGYRVAPMQPRDPEWIQIITFFLADAYCGNEEDILGTIRVSPGDDRILTLGIGSSVNHHLLHEMAVLGQGSHQNVRPARPERRNPPHKTPGLPCASRRRAARRVRRRRDTWTVGVDGQPIPTVIRLTRLSAWCRADPRRR